MRESGSKQNILGVVGLSLLLISPSLLSVVRDKSFSLFLPIFLLSQIASLLLLMSLIRRRWIIFTSTFVFVLTALFHWAHFLMFRFELTEAAVAAMMGTTVAEVGEFLNVVPWQAWFILPVFVVVNFLAIKSTPECWQVSRRTQGILFSVVLVAFGLRLMVTKSVATAVDDVVLKSQPLKTILVFTRGHQMMSEIEGKMTSTKAMNIPYVDDSALGPQVHILVIGESARRRNLAYYGYGRDTNAYTRKIADDLLIFKDVVSSANSTIQSVMHMLTYSRNDMMTSIIDIANRAGFRTYWLSNQAKFGAVDSPTHVIAARAHHATYINQDSTKTSHDELLLPRLDEILQEPEEKKLIVIHLMGSHYTYNKRYPKTFNVFSGKEIPVPRKYNAKQSRIINEYDNSILYTDYVLSEIITRAKAQEIIASLFYVSDHGEYLFEKSDFYGHGNVNSDKSEVEVPMLVWFSKIFKQEREAVYHQIANSVEKQVSLYDLFPSYLSMIGLKVQLDEKVNFFTREAMENDRIIFNMSMQKVHYRDLK